MTGRGTCPLRLDRGSEVWYRGKRHVIRQESSNFKTVLLLDPESGRLLEAQIADLSPAEAASLVLSIDLNDDELDVVTEAQRKYDVIKPLLELPNRTKMDVEKRATEVGMHRATLYRWLDLFQTTEKVSALTRKPRTDRGKVAISAETEKIVAEAIEASYLTRQKRSVSKVIREIAQRCAKANVPAPHANTVRKRIKSIDRYTKTKAREGAKAARQGNQLLKGHFPGADFPFSVVQVDHTPLDIILVDDIHRLPLKRPWLTLLIDVFSRMVLGYYISFDPPGNLSLGLCLSHAFLPKEQGLARLGIDSTWPCWGLPRTIHADNAKEFRGNMLKLACQEYGIDLEWRPVARPNYGAHIERLLGSLNEEIHGAPGTTFSNAQQRSEYDSEGEAVISLQEFERWFATLCVDIYHQSKHSELGMPPIAKWQEGNNGKLKARRGDKRR